MYRKFLELIVVQIILVNLDYGNRLSRQENHVKILSGIFIKNFHVL